MGRKLIFACVLIVFVLATAGDGFAQRTSLVLKRVQKFYKSAQTIQADVTAEHFDPTLKITDTFNGTIKLIPKNARTKRMYLRLDWQSPLERLSVVGDQYMLYRPTVNMAYIGSLAEVGNKFANFDLMKVLGSETEFTRKFKVKYKGRLRLKDRTPVFRLRLTPRFGTAFRFVNLMVDTNGIIRMMVITMKDKSTVMYFLSNVVVNERIDAKEFSILVPKSVKIIK